MRRTHVIALGVLVAVAGCDIFSGPSVGPPAGITMSVLPGVTVVGTTLDGITVTVKDKDGKAVSGATVTWTATGGTITPATTTTNADGIATVSWTVGTQAGSQSLTAAVGDIQTARTVSTSAGPLAELALTPDELTFESVGDTVFLSVAGRDEYGNVANTPSLDWLSTDPAVASVLGGRVISHSSGSTEVVATSGVVSGTAAIVVDQVMVGLRVSPTDPVMVRDETLQLAAVPVDARGSAMGDPVAASWSSSDPSVASVHPDGGLISAVAVGTAVVTASAGGHTGEATIDVRSGPRPTITGIAPSVLAVGDTATITGTGFSTSAGQNVVNVAGAAAEVLDASATQLTVALPGPGTFPCGPTGEQTVEVIVDQLAASAQHNVAGAAQVSLAVGQSVALHGSDVACNEIASGGTYVVSVFNVSSAPGGLTAFKLRGTAPAVAADATALVQRQQLRAASAAPPVRADPGTAGHVWMLDQNARIARQLGVPGPRERVGAADLLMPASVTVGATRTFRIPNLDATNICSTYHSVTARAVFVGTHSVIWEDEAAPLAGDMDARWQAIGQEYESVMHPIIEEYFGDPLAYDDFIGQNGRLFMLFSKRVNDFERSVNGFVFSGDFFGTNQCASSDQASIFYGTVATDPGSGYDGNTAPSWAWGMRATVIHEVKHLVSYAHSIRHAAETGGAPSFEDIWLEEATARLSEEFYARALAGYGQGDNVTYDDSIWCERRVGGNFPACDPIPAIMIKHFSGLYAYYRDIENLSPLGPISTSDGTFYGSGWLLVRWAMDHSNMTEAAFSRALVDEVSVTGSANLAARMGRPFRDMLADFTLAIAMDDRPGGPTTAPELTFPGWNTRDIMQGFHEDIGGTTYTSPWPLHTRHVNFGNFDVDVGGVRGGSASILQLTGGANARQLLELLSAGGAAAPLNLGMAIVRVH